VVTAIAALRLAAALAAGAVRAAHPLHTSLTELSAVPGGKVRLSIRVFADDLRAALARRGAASLADSAAFAYARETVTLGDLSGRRLPLTWCGLKRTGDLVWLCLEAAVATLPGLDVRVALFWDVFADQVNLVQAETNGHRQTLVLVNGDPPRRLR